MSFNKEFDCVFYAKIKKKIHLSIFIWETVYRQGKQWRSKSMNFCNIEATRGLRKKRALGKLREKKFSKLPRNSTLVNGVFPMGYILLMAVV